MRFNEAGVEHAATKFVIAQNFLVVGRGGLHALQTHVIQRTQATIHRLFPGQRPDNQLQTHGIEVRRNGVAGVNCRIHSHTGATRGVVASNLAERGEEVVLRVLGVDTELNGKALMVNIFLLDRQRQARSNADLFAHYVDAGDLLGNGVLDLNAGIHFHEIHFAFGEQKLHRAGVLVTHRLRRFHCQIADIGALFRR